MAGLRGRLGLGLIAGRFGRLGRFIAGRLGLFGRLGRFIAGRFGRLGLFIAGRLGLFGRLGRFIAGRFGLFGRLGRFIAGRFGLFGRLGRFIAGRLGLFGLFLIPLLLPRPLRFPLALSIEAESVEESVTVSANTFCMPSTSRTTNIPLKMFFIRVSPV
ncbi:MAG: hypothetical protein DRQ88_04045 [Epsilonproteobacteria bacterium]|nr:MAG: hypothetical protein DRQ88_04045 [Campylobacterota bacterium]